jgi:hypothetical protein
VSRAKAEIKVSLLFRRFRTGEFLEARIIPQRIEHRIEREQCGNEGFGLARVRGMGRPLSDQVNLFERHRLLRFFNDFLKTRIASQRVPPQEQLQLTIAGRGWETDAPVQLFDGEIFIANPGGDHCQMLYQEDSYEWIFFYRKKLNCTLAFAQRVLFVSEAGVD